MTTPPLTREQIEELLQMEREVWAAPWVAHAFEIDCPCPNGSHCGQSHTCEEVEAREAYPSSPEEPADPGEGQCVVQIDVPGLDTFAGPCARFIAASRNAFRSLAEEVLHLRAQRDDLQARNTELVEQRRAAEARTGSALPRVCPGSGYPVTYPYVAIIVGTGICGICLREIGVGSRGEANTHPYCAQGEP